ncbi:MAG: lipid A phosphoethanolamine transferase [Prevotella sp.]|nr:lipid A phosphoethanolamine transferase [Prevotella sp.]MDD7046006.1 phosphoethanolamine transferase [Prevotella sp.]MDY5546215.1 phosphoethanolamine transferase [Prevotella sp.]
MRMAFRPIELNAAFFVFMYVLGVVCSWVTDPHTRGFHYYDLTYVELFLDLYVCSIVLALIPRKVRVWVKRVLYVVLYATAIADVFCFVKFESTLNPTMLLLLDETNSREAGEFLQSYLSADVLFSGLGWILLLAVLHAVFALKPWRRIHINASERLQNMKVKHCYRQWSPLLGLATLVLFVYSLFACAKNKQATLRIMTLPTIGDVEHELTRLDDCANLYMPIYRLAFSVYANSLASQQIKKLIQAKNNVEVDSCTFRSPNIIFIIGESYNRHHAQIYGYDKPTTPEQDRLERSGMLNKFTDVIAPWNLTSYVFKNVFSLHVVGEKGEWCDYPLFPEVFRKAGYHVTFLTNQFLPKAKEAVYDFSGGFFLNNPELSAAQFDTRNTSLHAFDEGLLRDYDRLKSHNTAHNLIIFHLAGQHVSYNTRCPKDQRKFEPDDYDRPDLNARQRRILSDYDNAVHYNDSIVNQIVKLFEDQDAIVIYMPDHGEECFDGKVKFFGRMHSAQIDARLAREEFDIPFWIWCSHKYAVRHPEVFDEIVRARSRRLMTDAVPHLLLYLAGIHTKNYHPEYNILSDRYHEKRSRVIKATVDYDKLGVEK